MEGGTGMTASAPRAVATFLHSAGRLAAILAVLAGILGMHVTGSHSVHSPAATTVPPAATVQAETPADGHVIRQASDAPLEGMASGCAGRCSGNCTGSQTMTVSCTPATKSGSLAAPLPRATVIGVIPRADMAGAVPSGYSYVPGSPSPGELSISRT
jgi:hypothetical protein